LIGYPVLYKNWIPTSKAHQENKEKEEWISDLDKKEKKKYEAYARYSLNKQRRINIRMTERDLNKIRAKAIEEGIPYQSLISMLIHKFNEGKIVFARKRHS